MSKKLLIVESPAKAKTIEKYLAGEYQVKASIGHVRDLPKSNKNAIDIDGGFLPHYVISPGKEKVLAELSSLAKKADQVLLATDPDREGEAIAWHLQQVLGLKKPQRVVFHEITKEAVRTAVEKPRQLDDNLRQAQEARRVLDRLFGYDLSSLIWQKVRYGLSAGRVQSPALRLLVEKEKEIRAFVPEKYWLLEADLQNNKQPIITFECSEQPRDQQVAEKIHQLAQTAKWEIRQVEESETQRKPRPPFSTSTLQQAASSRLGFSPSITMRLAQKLYEAGHITYMRTDSVNLSQQAITNLSQAVKDNWGPEYCQSQQYATKTKNAQEAHEAIRPTQAQERTVKLGASEKKLYELIWRRAVASQMTPAKLWKTKLVAGDQAKQLPDFVANGQRLIFPGWLVADPQAQGEEKELPKCHEGDELTLKGFRSWEKYTEAPHRYTEAGLVKELEKRGIGRPSTYATIIKTLLDRGYALKENRSLQATETGEIVSDFLDEHFHEYISDTFTAQMEDQLDDIASGQGKYLKTLSDFYTPFTKTIKAKKKIEKITNLGPAPDEMKCPNCQGPMIIKLGKSGKFFSCAKFPECTGSRLADGTEMTQPKDLGRPCPRCQEGSLVSRQGKYGPFIACSRYPKCRYIEQDEQASKLNDTGVKCPVCQRGTMVEKRGRYGFFYGCSNYPECKHIIKSKPTGRSCDLCSSLMMVGTKTIPERCSNKECPNHNPHKLNKKLK